VGSDEKLNENGFASNVMHHLWFGYAAGYAAVALPRRRVALYIFGLCP
jgi:hypothetical protein